jgi:hypothetical protein
MLLTVIMLLFANLFAQELPVDMLKRIDLKYYEAFDASKIKDFYMEAEVDGLAEKLNAQKSYGSVSSLVFKIYWTPKETAVEIVGLGSSQDSYPQVKLNLVQLIIALNPYLTHVRFEQLLRGLSLRAIKKVNGDLEFKGEDPLRKSELQLVEIVFDQNNLLKTSHIQSALSSRKYEKNNYRRFPWSLNQYVLEKQIYTEVFENNKNHKIVDETAISYKEVDGRGYVSEIDKISYVLDEKGKKIDNSENKLNVEFSNFSVNKGLAENYFNQRNKEIEKARNKNAPAKNKRP